MRLWSLAMVALGLVPIGCRTTKKNSTSTSASPSVAQPGTSCSHALALDDPLPFDPSRLEAPTSVKLTTEKYRSVDILSVSAIPDLRASVGYFEACNGSSCVGDLMLLSNDNSDVRLGFTASLSPGQWVVTTKSCMWEDLASTKDPSQKILLDYKDAKGEDGKTPYLAGKALYCGASSQPIPYVQAANSSADLTDVQTFTAGLHGTMNHALFMQKKLIPDYLKKSSKLKDKHPEIARSLKNIVALEQRFSDFVLDSSFDDLVNLTVAKQNNPDQLVTQSLNLADSTCDATEITTESSNSGSSYTSTPISTSTPTLVTDSSTSTPVVENPTTTDSSTTDASSVGSDSIFQAQQKAACEALRGTWTNGDCQYTETDQSGILSPYGSTYQSPEQEDPGAIAQSGSSANKAAGISMITAGSLLAVGGVRQAFIARRLLRAEAGSLESPRVEPLGGSSSDTDSSKKTSESDSKLSVTDKAKVWAQNVKTKALAIDTKLVTKYEAGLRKTTTAINNFSQKIPIIKDKKIKIAEKHVSVMGTVVTFAASAVLIGLGSSLMLTQEDPMDNNDKLFLKSLADSFEKMYEARRQAVIGALVIGDGAS